jgi:hypothetical protein
MRILAYDPGLSLQEAEAVRAQPVDFDTLLRESDFITIHTPLTPQTRSLINRDALAKMKPTAILVNTARGPVVDAQALYDALKTGVIGGAALDVTDPEPLPPDSPLLTLPNLLVVPHIGSASYAKTVHDESLLELARSVVRRIGYRGLCGIEFKRDPRDDRYKLIEFNARYGLWDCLGERAGVDLAGHAYRAALGERLEPSWSYRAGLTWVSFQRDLGAYRAYRREGSLSLSAWLATVLGCDAHAIFALDDLRPFISSTLELLQSRLERLRQRGPRAAATALSAPGPAR